MTNGSYFFLLAILVIGIVFWVRPVRRLLISSWIMRIVARVLPKLGETERVALEAGTVWWDGDLFSGDPNWVKLLSMPTPALSSDEEEFLKGPVEELCKMLNDWEVRQKGDLPPEIWKFIKVNRFFGMAIPKEFGGHDFSALAHSAVVTKISSRSITAAVTVMVPNSLGPAELLLHYGTAEQKQYYLPRLARGEEIPCFALTGPEAGSDAAATESVGVLCKGFHDGREILGIRLNWRKRYITLGPVATLIGLAFQLKDPEHFLGAKEKLGITCALVPAHLKGITIGERHDPMGVPFQNGPNEGHDVFIPADYIIGGLPMAGHGWKMLMESLAAGRSVSLPALSVGGMQLALRVVGAYGTVREQFDTPIGRFEGIEEPLARIGGFTYMMNAARVLTAGAVDQGEKPSVISAIAKAYLTETMRKVINDAMDICGGAGICRGPRNMLEQVYTAVPIAITVEGANILTRSMIIFGQGAIRCHPFVQKEMHGIESGDLVEFDRAFFGHLGFVARNTCRVLLHGLSGGRLVRIPVSGGVGIYFSRVTRLSAAFALLSDASMGTLGGTLKRHEKLCGRLADALAWMYMASATLKRYVDDGQRQEHLPYVRWACEHATFKAEDALAGVLRNFPLRPAAWALAALIFPLGRRYLGPSDELGAQVASGVLEDHEARRCLTSDIYIPGADEPGLGKLEVALGKATAALPVEAKLRHAIRAGRLSKGKSGRQLEDAVAVGVITATERAQMLAADEIRDEVIQVDSFSPAAYQEQRR